MELIVLFGVVAAALLVWTAFVLVRHYSDLEQPLRLPKMLARLGLAAEDVANSDLAPHLPTAGRLCLLCGHTEACDQALAAESGLEEPPDYCPNASFLKLAKRGAPPK